KEAWNALLKLIEEPPPHLIFVFCTTERSKVLPTVQSRCQSFDFQRPRLPDLIKLLRKIADGESMDVPDAALGLIARAARGSFRDGVSTLDQLASATGGTITVQDVLQLLGAVEDEVLFRLCDLVVDGDTAGALVFLEELSERGQDLGRLVVDLLEHLRHLLLVQHTGEVPETLPVTAEAGERLREQANQLGPATVIRLIDLLAVAVEDMRQGGDPRLPLELALVKVTRPASDLSREGMAYRLDRLEQGAPVKQVPEIAVSETEVKAKPAAPKAEPPSIELAQLKEAWKRTVLPAVEQRGSGGMPAAAMLAEAHPAGLDGDTLTIEFPPAASFHRQRAEEPKNAKLLAEALYEVTGKRLSVVFAEGPERVAKPEKQEQAATEEEILELVKSTLDATEVDV
ncbi:MAG TPA: hypothetical protein VGL76_09665, partial [Gaiellaceae bacterium]